MKAGKGGGIWSQRKVISHPERPPSVVVISPEVSGAGCSVSYRDKELTSCL